MAQSMKHSVVWVMILLLMLIAMDNVSCRSLQGSNSPSSDNHQSSSNSKSPSSDGHQSGSDSNNQNGNNQDGNNQGGNNQDSGSGSKSPPSNGEGSDSGSKSPPTGDHGSDNGSKSPPSDNHGSDSGFKSPPESPPTTTPPPSTTTPPPSSPSPLNSPPPTSTPPPPSHSTSPPLPPSSPSPPPPTTPSPSPPTPTPSPNPSTSPTPTPPSSTPSTPPPTSTSPPPPPSSLLSPPSTPTSPSPPIKSPTPPQSPTPSSPTPSTPPPSTSTPHSPLPPSSPSPSPPTTTPSSPPSPPLPPSTSPKKANCKNKNYPQCYDMEFVCPSTCPGGCEVDCVSCRPVCKCDMPGAVCQDPRFIGGDGITFYFHGKKDRDFCLVSDSNLHINAHFIGKRSLNMTRDFTWVQSIAILFDTHKLFLGALKTSSWDDSVDRLSLSFDGQPIFLPLNSGARWRSAALPAVSISRIGDTNSVSVEVEGNLKITAKVVAITEEDSRIHKYGVTRDDCFAHLDLGFKFLDLSDGVSGVLGQTYGRDYVSKVKMGVLMPVMGGEREFASSSLFAVDCSVARFRGQREADSFMGLEMAGLRCGSGMGGQGVVCKR